MTSQPKSRPDLSSAQIKFLRAKAHPLKVVISVGNKGVSPSLLEETDIALNSHELIKIKLPAVEKSGKLQLLDEIIQQTTAIKVQLIGRVGIVYRPAKPAIITLPKK